MLRTLTHSLPTDQAFAYIGRVSVCIDANTDVPSLERSFDICPRAGKTIAESKDIYHDFIDLKPPLFFMLYAFIYKTIGISQIALRSFDFLNQLATALFLYKIVKKNKR
jgi:predicted amidophosphoribosyltransferase